MEGVLESKAKAGQSVVEAAGTQRAVPPQARLYTCREPMTSKSTPRRYVPSLQVTRACPIIAVAVLVRHARPQPFAPVIVGNATLCDNDGLYTGMHMKPAPGMQGRVFCLRVCERTAPAEAVSEELEEGRLTTASADAGASPFLDFRARPIPNANARRLPLLEEWREPSNAMTGRYQDALGALLRRRVHPEASEHRSILQIFMMFRWGTDGV